MYLHIDVHQFATATQTLLLDVVVLYDILLESRGVYKHPGHGTRTKTSLKLSVNIVDIIA